MAMEKKFRIGEDGKIYKTCVSCKCEKEVGENFYNNMRDGELIISSKCKPCKKAYNFRYRMDRKKNDRKKTVQIEEDLKSLREYINSWKPVVDLAKQNPLAHNFKTPQDFILATLKTVYDGRTKENL